MAIVLRSLKLLRGKIAYELLPNCGVYAAIANANKINTCWQYQYLLNPKDTLAEGGTIDFDLKGKDLKDAIYANFENLGLDGAVFTAGKSGKVPYGKLKKYYRNQDLVNAGGGNTTQPDSDEEPSNKVENLQFYYHPDHLGSSSYITDVSGEVYQHMEYFPFGETFIEERTDAEYTSFLYNGKELDEETGLYYYGARYYDPQISMWYGVDPLAEKYPGISSFAYTANNPTNYVDLDGREIDGVTYNKKTKEFSYSESALAAGVNKYIQARTSTKGGEKDIMKMIDSKEKFSIMITDKPLFVGGEKEGYGRVMGVVVDNSLYISTNTNKELSDEDFSNSMLLDAHKNEINPAVIDPSKIFKGTEDPIYNLAMKKSGLIDYELDSNNSYKSTAELLNGVGAHEETHLFQSYWLRSNVFRSEVKAMKKEVKARQDYKSILKTK